MNALLSVAIGNAAVAAALFTAVWTCKPWLRNPAVLHLLWVLVLLKLWVPPLWGPRLAWLRETDSTAAASSATRSGDTFLPPGPSLDDETAIGPTEAAGTVAANLDAPPAAERTSPAPVSAARWAPASLAVAVWGTGATFWFALALWRIARFERCLKFAQPAAAAMQETAVRLAAQMGLRRCPQVWLVPARVSPMLWSFAGPARLIVPSELFAQLDRHAREALLLHELAHYRRGDHWVRLLELISLGAFWWHPVAWLLRREIRAAEERACDAWVVSQRPDQRRHYAATLVQTIGFLSAPALPPTASGVGAHGNLERRLITILRGPSERRVSWRAKTLLGSLAILLLPLAPALVRAQHAADPAGSLPAGAEPAQPDNAQGDQPQDDTAVGTLVTPDGQPVAGAEVIAYVDARRDRAFKTNEAGQFRVPRAWRDLDAYSETLLCLFVQDGDERMSWFDFPHHGPRATGQTLPPDGSFRLVLLPRAQTVRGVLVDAEGKPLPGIRVEVDGLHVPENGYIGQDSLGGEVPLGAAVSDAAGTFSIPLPQGAHATLYPRHPDWQRRPMTLKPDAGDLGRVTLAQAGRIEGRVVDADTRNPLPGQRVFAHALGVEDSADFVSYADATTGEDGTFVLGGLSPGVFNVLLAGRGVGPGAEPQWTAPAHEGVEVVAGQAATVQFRAGPGRRLAGKVVDFESGEPLADISVRYHGPARPESGGASLMVRTQRDGSFEFRVPPGVSRVDIVDDVDRTRIPDSTRTLEVPADRDLENVVLKAGPKTPALEGAYDEAAATDEEAQPAGPRPFEALVKLSPPEGRHVNKVEVHTVFRGSQQPSQWSLGTGTEFTVPFARWEDGATAFLLIEAPGFAQARSAPFVVRERMPQVEIALVPEVLVPVHGRVLDPQGNVAAGARVRVRRRIYGVNEEFPWGLEYTTDAEGRFQIEHARLGDRIRLRIDREGTGGAESDWIVLDTPEPRTLPDLRLGLLDQVLGGTVLDGDGFPVADAKVVHLGEPRVEARTDAAGKFRLAGLPTGEVQLSIEWPGLPRELRTARSGKLDYEFHHVERLTEQDRSDYQVTVTLRPRDGQAVPRVTLFFCVHEGELLMWMPERSGNSHQVDFARFARRHQDQQFALIVAAEGYVLSDPVVVPNRRRPDPVTIDLEPAAPARVLGRVIDEQGQPVSGAKVGLSVALNNEATHEPWRYFNAREKLPLTDDEGKFEVPGVLPNSRAAVYVNKAGYSGVWSPRVLIEKRGDRELPELRLAPATGQVSGRVIDEQGRPVADAIVFVHDLDRVETTSDSDGRFQLRQVPRREVWLRALSEHGQWARQVTPDAHDLEVTLQARW